MIRNADNRQSSAASLRVWLFAGALTVAGAACIELPTPIPMGEGGTAPGGAPSTPATTGPAGAGGMGVGGPGPVGAGGVAGGGAVAQGAGPATGGGGSGGIGTSVGGMGGDGGHGGVGGAPQVPLPMCDPATPAPPCAQPAAVAPGDTHSCVLASDGYVRCWGANLNGQLGDPARPQTSSLPPKLVPNLTGVTQLVSGLQHSCALVGSALYCWGRNASGELGLGDVIDRHEPTQVLLPPVTQVATSFETTCVATTVPSVMCWGQVLDGQPWNGPAQTETPTTVAGLEAMGPIGNLTVSISHACASSTDGMDVRCWGDNGNGLLGDGTSIDSAAAVQIDVSLNRPSAHIDTANNTMCALGGPNRELQCWGFFGTTFGSTYTVPTELPGVPTTAYIDVQLGWTQLLLHKDDGSVEGFGVSNFGELGPLGGNGQPVTTPVPIVSGVSKLTAGWQHSCAILDNHEVRCWGRNQRGQVNPASVEEEIREPALVVFSD